MKTGRLEAFSDGVMAIIITIMVLELKAPEGHEWSDFATSASGPRCGNDRATRRGSRRRS